MDSEFGKEFSKKNGIEDLGDYSFCGKAAGLSLYSPDDYIKRVVLSEERDLGSALYEDAVFRDRILSYYANVAGSALVAETVTRYAYENKIPFTLAFALMWAESRFDPLAVNRNPVSIDRGLFQLNSESFPHLSVEDFFDIEINVRTGLQYLRSCLEKGETEIIGLAIYNAGHYRVSSAGAPMMTLEHISKILTYKSELERDFQRYISREGRIRTDKKAGGSLVKAGSSRS
jgi:hypothetical protein